MFKYTWCLNALFEDLINLPRLILPHLLLKKKLTWTIYNKKLSYNILSVNLLKHDALGNIHREVSSITLLSTQWKLRKLTGKLKPNNSFIQKQV